MTKDLKLVLVNVFHRHGERSPLNIYEEPLGRLRACSKMNEYHERLPVPKISFIKSFFSSGRSPLNFELIYKPLSTFECAPGQLTDHGKRTLFNFGRKLKKDYVDTGFISSKFENDSVHLTSTDFQRTIESLQSLCKGLFSKTKDPIPINIGKKGVKSLYTSKYCDYYLKESEKHRKEVKERHSDNIKTITNYINKKYSVFGSKFGIYEIFDVVMSSIGNKNNFFSGFSNKILKMTEDYSLDLFFGHLEKKRNLSIYRGEIIRDLHDRIKDKIAGRIDSMKMYILSAHDTTIYPILMAFGIHDQRWPDFGSNLIYETFKDKFNQHYVRVKYNGVIKVLPGCENTFRGDKSLCNVEDFLKICKEYIPKNKEKLCRV